jgi:hypothetical protein
MRRQTALSAVILLLLAPAMAVGQPDATQEATGAQTRVPPVIRFTGAVSPNLAPSARSPRF